MKTILMWVAVWAAGLSAMARGETRALVLQTDFGTKDGAVAAMRGVAFGVSARLPVFDLSHENTPYDIWEAAFAKLSPKFGDVFTVTIAKGAREAFRGEVPYARTFGEVPEGKPLIYLNSLLNVGLALNMGDFAKTHGVASGAVWSVRIEKTK